MTSGTALSGAQLNAVANVPGALVYSPAAGTVLSPGTRPLTVTFSPADASDYTSATVNNSITVQAAPAATAVIAPQIIWTAPVAIRYGTAVSGVQLNATASVPGSFVYSPAAGTEPKAGTQTLSATFTPSDTKAYSTATASVQLTVTKVAPVIAWATPGSIRAGTALSRAQLYATASVPGSFTYNPPQGTVLVAGTRALSVVFSPTDTLDYTPVTANNSIVVSGDTSKTAPTITWHAPPSVTYGASLGNAQLNASANVPGTFAYTPVAGTLLKAGTHTLSASFTPADTGTYSAPSAMVLFTVAKATPVVTWSHPAAITQGTALALAQLDAKASVQGTFSYSPGAGTVLPVGTRPLTGTFTPVDTTDYVPVTVSNSVTVDAQPTPSKPTITWNVPAAITYGTALGNLQLDAMANASGSFAYNPPAGTVLRVGTRTLAAVFTPSDAKTYSAATASLEVNSSAIPDILILVLVSGCKVGRLRSLMASRQFIEFTAKDCWPLGSRQATAGMGHEQLSSPQGVSGRSRFRSRSFGRAPQPPGALDP